MVEYRNGLLGWNLSVLSRVEGVLRLLPTGRGSVTIHLRGMVAETVPRADGTPRLETVGFKHVHVS